jgi:hypothetical protein
MNHKTRYTRAQLLAIAFASVVSVVHALKGQTFLRPKPLSQDMALELGLYEYNIQYGKDIATWCPWLSMQISPFYFRSTNKDKIAQYFLPNCKQCITVAQNNTSDVSSPWLGLVNTEDPFDSTVCLCPYRVAWGAALNFYVSGKDVVEGCLRNLWFSVFMPIAQIRTNLQITEKLNGGRGTATGLETAIQALNNPTWEYGTFPVCTQTKTGIDDVQVKLGWELARNECSGGGIYAVLYIPSGHESRACTIFEPTLGSGDHAGLGGGLYGDYVFWEGCASSLSVLANVRYAYFFRGTETRSFDLTNGAWSRYMLFANQITPQISFPAINFLTFPVEVTPRGTVDVWAALHYNHCNWDLELGYEFWWRQAEDICIKCDPFAQSVSIFDIGRAGTEIPLTSASTATISQGVGNEADGPVSDAVFTPLTLSSLRVSSGANPKTYTNKVYGAVSWNFEWLDYGGIIGFGASYEHAHNRGALSQAGGWIKAAVNF